MSGKEMPDDPVDLKRLGRWLRDRVAGHSPDYKVTVYATPRVWLAVAAVLDPSTRQREEIERLREALEAIADGEGEAQVIARQTLDHNVAETA